MSLLRIPIAAAAVAMLGLISPSTSRAQQVARGAEGDSQVAVDETGRLRPPTPEERHELNEARRAEQLRAVDPTPVVRADGSVHVQVPEHLESVSVARIEDGKVVTRCFESRAEAEAFLAGAPRAPAAEEK